MSTPPLETFEHALQRCPALTTQTLDGFLDGLLEMDMEQLAQLPGSPGQVLAAQFTYYARSSGALEEELLRQSAVFQALADALRRLPNPKSITRRRKSRGDPPRTQAAGG